MCKVFRMDLIQNKQAVSFRPCYFCFPNCNQSCLHEGGTRSVSHKKTNEGINELSAEQRGLLQYFKENRETHLMSLGSKLVTT